MKNLGDQRRGKLTSLFTSERRYSRSGSITTTVEKEDDMRNSRISNLPNYKRETLECRLDFVVVFQTIEIQRLSVEIESLRVRLIDSERQIFNYKNYEVQIRQLTERCFEYEKEKSRNEQEMARLMMALRQAEEGYEEAKERVAAYQDQLREREDQVFRFKEELIIERKQRQQVEDFRLQLQSNLKQKEKAYSRQLRELEKSTQLRKTDLSKNQQNLNNLLRKYQDEIKDLRKENGNLRAFYDSIEQQSKDLEARYEDLQQELSRTADTLREKEFQLETVQAEGRERLDSLQAKYEEQFREKCQQVEDSENEVAELRSSIDRLEAEVQRYQSCLSEYQQKKEKYEMFLNEAGDEIDRLNTIIKDKNKYLQAWQTRYKELQGKNSALEQDLIKIQHKLASSQEEVAKLSYTIKTKTDQLEKLQRQRENQMHQVRERLSQAETVRSQMTTLRKEKEQEREEAKRRQLQNAQLKEQLNRRVAESNKIFEDLHRIEAELKTCKACNYQLENAVRQRDQDAKRALANAEAANAKCDKLLGERRGFQQELVRMKGLQQRLKHEESKKNQYLSEGKKLSIKVKELQKANHDKKISLQLTQEQLKKYTEYARQAQQKIAQLEDQIESLMQMKREIAVVNEKNKVCEQQIRKLSSALNQRTQQLTACKEKVAQYDKYIRQFRVQQQRFKEELASNQRILNELKQLKAYCNQLEDEKMELESYLVKVEGEKAQSLKEVSNLEKVIAINSQELKRVEQHLAETKQELANKKDNQKILFAKIKEVEKKVRSSESQVEKQKNRLAKERAQAQRQMEKKNKQLQNALKGERQQKEKLQQARQRLIKQKQTSISLVNEKNEQLKEALRRSEDEMEKIFRYSKELQKKIMGVEHELQRLTAKDQQTTKELQIAIANNEKALHRTSQQEATFRQQSERIVTLNAQQDDLNTEMGGLKEQLRGKESDIGHLMEECRQYKEEMALLYDEIKEHGEIHSEQIAEIIKVKFQSQNILQLYNALRVRMNSLEAIIVQLKTHLNKVLTGQRGLAKEKAQLQRRLLQFQEALLREAQRFEQVQFKQCQEIIRLETLNKILQIEVGEYKERESVMFSMVKEASIIKERETKARLQHHTPEKSDLAFTPRTLKESTIGQINILSKKSRTTRMQEEQLQDQGQGLRSETGVKGSKNRVYFQNLVFKNI